MKKEFETFQDATLYAIDEARRDYLLSTHEECTVCWSTTDGWPMGLMHKYIWKDGHFWVTATVNRVRVPALRKRPKSAIVVACEQAQGITAKTLCTVHEPGNQHAHWFYRALAEQSLRGHYQARNQDVTPEAIEAFVPSLDTPDRVILEFEPIKWITYDGRKVGAFRAGKWRPGEPWIEPDAAKYKTSGV